MSFANLMSKSPAGYHMATNTSEKHQNTWGYIGSQDRSEGFIKQGDCYFMFGYDVDK